MGEPKTGREAMATLDAEGMRLEGRDRRVAMSIGSEMLERYFDPERIGDMRDVREQIIRAAEHAAYEAIQKERELHAGDMAALRAWADVKWAEDALKPVQILIRDSDTRPKDGDAKQGSTRE